MKAFTLFIAGLIALMAFEAPVVFADGGMHKPYKGSEAFERIKQLAGNWQGTIDMGKGPQKIIASYRVTAAGSAIVETVFEGAPHEMVSIYHDNSKGALTMVHYCAEHNQPKFALKNMDAKNVTMELTSDSDIDVAKDKHIHVATIRFDGEGKMTQLWTGFENGKKGHVAKITYTRID
ncbi:MAG: hypothetical protein ACQ9MH_02310 [Nitrospinales bacterium]